MKDIYLDNSATTKVCPEAAQAVMRLLCQVYGNPSSLHAMGAAAELALSRARQAVAKALGCNQREVFFTSGGTEANNLALFGGAAARRRLGNRIVTTRIEHPSVYEPALQLQKQGFDVVFLEPDRWGNIPPEAVFDAVTPDTILVSMMLVNNETGARLPVEAAAKAIKRTGAPALLHCDGVQAFGKIPCKPSALGADLMTVSAHKIHGPKGTGALFIRKGVRIEPRTFGGGQEQGLRPGTEAAALIAGFGAAVEALPKSADFLAHASRLKEHLLFRLEKTAGISFNSPADSVPYLVNLSVEGIRSETMLHHLAAKGISVSSGSACSKGKRSRVLAAQCLADGRIDGALRVSFSQENVLEDIDALVEGLLDGMARLARR